MCSTAAGPAFEGVGVSCGTPAMRGAIDRVTVVNQSLVPHIIGDGEAQGVCGSGLIDALIALSQIEELDSTGHLMSGVFQLSDTVQLSQDDIHALLVSKSAIRSGIDTLLYTAGISANDVDVLCLAGGFGTALNPHAVSAIGLLPKECCPKLHNVGNAALRGAMRFLWDARSLNITKSHKVNLATDAYFADAFIRNMTLK